MKVILVTTNNEVKVKEIQETSLIFELRNLVSGYLEPVRPRVAYENKLMTPGTIFLCDEDGHAYGRSFNLVGSVLYNGTLPPFDHSIVGDIVIIGEDKDLRGLKDNEISRYLDILATLKEASQEYLVSCQK